MKKTMKWAAGITGGVVGACVIGLAVTGWQIGWGPFHFLFKGFEGDVRAIEQRYDPESRRGEIVFYGASNFRLWKEMDEDLSAYKVQNHGFGGSTDRMLMQYADRILYPYEPKIVVFQTGSNDLANLPGTREEKLAACLSDKREIFALFHARLPDTQFIVMSGLLLPGRSQYTEMTQEINRQLREMCEVSEYMTFVDAEDFTFDGTDYAEELFISDGIHLTHEARLRWRDEYILPALERVIEENGFDDLRR